MSLDVAALDKLMTRQDTVDTSKTAGSIEPIVYLVK